MSAPYFVETLARNGDVLHRHQVDALPIRLGRGYDNDYILDDDYAAASHAIIEADDQGQMVLRDLGSKNGVIHQGKRKTSLAITGDTVIRLGHTSLRVRAADFPVPGELLDRTMHGWEGIIPGVVGLALIGLFSLFTVWLSDTKTFSIVTYLQALAFGIGAGLVWGGLWAFGNRLFGRHARLGRHLFIFGCGMAAITTYKVVSSLSAYAFSLEQATRYGFQVAIMLVAGMVYFHLSTVKPQRARRFAVICLVLGLFGTGLTMIGNKQRTGRVSDELYMALLLPPSLRVSPNHTVDEFVGDVNAMKARLDQERANKIKDDSDDD